MPDNTTGSFDYQPSGQARLEELAFSGGPAILPEVTEFTMDVSSTCCAQVIYDAQSQTLAIQFQKRGTYVYNNFPMEDYTEFANSGSKGQYFNENIRGQFEYERIG